MMRFDGDLVELLLAVAEGRLAGQGPVQLAERAALTVVMAANGYPGTPEKGGAITGIDAAEAAGARVFHAGTADKDGAIVANGGRVLNVTATGDTVKAAQQAAYKAVDAIGRSEEHTSELQSLMRISYAVFCLKKKNTHKI